MPDEKFIIDAIQELLDKNNGFMPISSLDRQLSLEVRTALGFKNNDLMKIKAKKLEKATGKRFIVHYKRMGNGKEHPGNYYVVAPCDPAEMLASFLAQEGAMSPKILCRRLPLTRKDVFVILNELAEAGRLKTVYNEKLDPQVSIVAGSAAKKQAVSSEPKPSGEYTQAKFRKAYDELHKSREFVRICDLRRSLNWPREVFDEMVRRLRDSMAVQLMQADGRRFSKEELADCFVDENNYRMGTIDWNGR